MEKVLFLACRQIHLYLDQNKQKGGGKAGVSREQTSHYCQLLRNTEKQPMGSKHKKLEISPGNDYTLKSFPHAEQLQSEIKSSWQLGQALAEVADTAKGRHPKKNRFFLGNSPKQRTPPTHPYGLGLT